MRVGEMDIEGTGTAGGEGGAEASVPAGAAAESMSYGMGKDTIEFEIPDAPAGDEAGGGAEPEKEFFAYGDKKFKSAEELSEFIKTLQSGQPQAGQAGTRQYDEMSRGLKTAMQQIQKLERQISGQGATQTKGAGEPAGETNPFDPDVKPVEWHKWELDHRLQAQNAEWGKKFESLEEQFETQRQAAFGQAVLSNYKQTFSHVAGDLRIDPEFKEIVEFVTANSQEVNASINAETGEVDPQVVRQMASKFSSWIKSIVDKKLTASSKEQKKLMEKHPPSLTRGAATSMPAGGKPINAVPPSARKGTPDSYNRIGQMLANRRAGG